MKQQQRRQQQQQQRIFLALIENLESHCKLLNDILPLQAGTIEL